MPVTDDDCAIILNALFDYGMTNRERAEGMPAQGLYPRGLFPDEAQQSFRAAGSRAI